MATLENGPSGGFKGRVGPLVYREENGKTIISTYSKKIKTVSKKAKRNRMDFSVCSYCCLAVLKIEMLNAIWRKTDYNGRTAGNKILSANRRIIKNIEDVDNIILIPAPSFFDVTVLEYSITVQHLKIKIAPLQNKIWDGRCRVSAQGIMYWTDTNENFGDYFLFPVSSPVMDLVADEPMEFTFWNPHTNYHPYYRYKKFVVNLITYDSLGKIVEVSKNMVGECPFEG